MNNDASSIVYGIHAVEQLIEHRMSSIERVYFDVKRAESTIFYLLKKVRKEKIPYHCIPLRKLDEIAETTKHQGVAALCSIKPYDDVETLMERLKQIPAPLLIIPASCEDPRNLGALIRSSVAFGVTAILLERKQTAPLTSTVAKASAGMIEKISLVKPANLEQTVSTLKTQGFQIIGATAETEQSIDNSILAGPLVLIIGGEHRGIPPYLKKLCTAFVRIPISNEVSSLNMTVAASIILYECAKQNRNK